MANEPQPGQPFLQQSELPVNPGNTLQPEPIIVGETNVVLASLASALAYGEVVVQAAANK